MACLPSDSTPITQPAGHSSSNNERLSWTSTSPKASLTLTTIACFAWRTWMSRPRHRSYSGRSNRHDRETPCCSKSKRTSADEQTSKCRKSGTRSERRCDWHVTASNSPSLQPPLPQRTCTPWCDGARGTTRPRRSQRLLSRRLLSLGGPGLGSRAIYGRRPRAASLWSRTARTTAPRECPTARGKPKIDIAAQVAQRQRATQATRISVA
mmetsp:Transcript_25740/g.59401  ORF Transcript_25740/g.59401 Transcript_25740/m.59401 type:complete len:210 (-) Transcript_25740:947-1576(-)